MQISSQGKIFFYLMLAFVFIVTFVLLKPYLGVIVFSVVVVVVTKPLFDLILRWVGNRKGAATTITIIVLGLAVLIPLLFVINITVSQASVLADDLSALVAGRNDNLTDIIEEINLILAKIPYVNYQLSEDQILEAVRKMVGPVSGYVAERAISLGRIC